MLALNIDMYAAWQESGGTQTITLITPVYALLECFHQIVLTRLESTADLRTSKGWQAISVSKCILQQHLTEPLLTN